MAIACFKHVTKIENWGKVWDRERILASPVHNYYVMPGFKHDIAKVICYIQVFVVGYVNNNSDICK